MQSILDRLEQLEGWKELMSISCRANGLPATLAGDLTVLKVRQLEDRFKKRSTSHNSAFFMALIKTLDAGFKTS